MTFLLMSRVQSGTLGGRRGELEELLRHMIQASESFPETNG